VLQETWGIQTRAVQGMLDFDYVCRRSEPSVAAMVYPMVGGDSKQNFYWGHKEILIPIYKSMADAMKNHPDVDVMIFIKVHYTKTHHLGYYKYSFLLNFSSQLNFVSLRSACEVCEALIWWAGRGDPPTLLSAGVLWNHCATARDSTSTSSHGLQLGQGAWTQEARQLHDKHLWRERTGASLCRHPHHGGIQAGHGNMLASSWRCVAWSQPTIDPPAHF